MIPPQFEYTGPTSLDDALSMLAGNQETAKILAGGHSLLPLMKLRLAAPSMLIDVGKVDSLRYIDLEDGMLRVGALTRYVDLQSSELVHQHAPVLAQAASTVGDAQVRNRGTIGGSIAHADPAADMPSVVTSISALIELRSVRGAREVSADDFFRDIFETALEPDEILTGIRIPVVSSPKQYYEKYRRRLCDWAIVGVAASASIDSSGRISTPRVVLTNVGPKPIRAHATEETLDGREPRLDVLKQASEVAATNVTPTPEINAPTHYKQHLVRVMTMRALAKAIRIRDVMVASHLLT